MTQTTSEILDELNRAAKSGAISKSSTEDLNKFASALCHSQAYSAFGEREFPQVCETVRLHLLRAHIEKLQKHITKLNKENKTTQYCVIVLTAFAILFGAIQVYYASVSDIREKALLQHSRQAEINKQAQSSRQLPSLSHHLSDLPKPTIVSSGPEEKAPLRPPVEKIKEKNRQQ